jgi:hypothetical protein
MKGAEVLYDRTGLDWSAKLLLRTISTSSIKNRIRNCSFMGTKIEQQ